MSDLPAPIRAYIDAYNARDVEAMSLELATEPVLLVVRQTSEPDAIVTPLPLDTSAIPNDHLQYAVTWFGLALVWVAMTGHWISRILRDKG
ncbi:MAG: SURF1 family cytochrome oxidase biogenesis protein [Pseudomonadota bacterium]